ncbi:MAG TPA: hypothetical protein VNN22_15405 [Verrucomicrobiae bacterium]|nr:hypothetical protein [Verrucomicrobiae bacterium]
MNHQCRNGFENDLQIQPECFVSRILDVQLDHLGERRVIFSAHLPEAGQTRQRVEPFPLPWQIFFVFVEHAGARADQTHVAKEDIHQLGQLIKAGGPQQSAKGNNPRITFRIHFQHRHIRFHQLIQVPLMNPRVCVDEHGSKFITQKPITQITNPLLFKNGRPSGNHPDDQGD